MLNTPIPDKLVTVAKITGAHGVRGQLKVQSFTEPKENFSRYQKLYWFKNNQWAKMPVVKGSIKQVGNTFVLNIIGCDDRDLAKKHQFTDIAVNRSELPALIEGQYYWTDLEGLKVYTVFGKTAPKYLGVVDHLIETGSNDVLVVKHEANKYLVPYILDNFVLSIDLEQGIIIVDWDPEF